MGFTRNLRTLSNLRYWPPQAEIEISSFHDKYISVAYQMKGLNEEKLKIAFKMKFEHVGSGGRPFSNMAAMKTSEANEVNKLSSHEYITNIFGPSGFI